MTTVILILGALVIAGAVVFFLMKSGKIEDKDGNNIPDSVEKKVEEVKEAVVEVKKRVKRVKEEVSDVVEASKKVVKQAKGVASAAKGETRKGRKPKQK